MRLHRIALGALVAATLALTGCGATKDQGSGGAASSGGGAPATGLQYMVPNSPGGGYDTTARTAAQVMEKEKITGSVQVFNLPGAGGTVGLQRVVNEKGNGKLAMQMGLGVVGAAYTQKSQAKLSETTPIAKLIEEAGAIVVPSDSPYQDITSLVAAWKKDPKSLAVGGGSSPGGPDHLLPMRLADAAGIDPKTVSYVSYDGGGELLPAILGKKIAFGASGFGEFLDQVEAGDVKILAVTSAERVAALPDVPTLKESGIDLEFTNWRGVVAPPGISDADKQVWIDAFTKMHDSQAWKDELEKRGWVDAFATGDEFGAFIADQDTRVADVLTTLGLA
ncbi:tripartite tricarboxylate transporter substrate binding protein [Phycicoccus sp. MAQZ13P-2]|uniref:Bug family tripartite tricarboxylate transporter substrate binding protein n=1 Tax=Phycicoccus mangrovi TaxID=2840470 RepID=UPI001C0032BC|nr:tripartite tricarboxylate transporter substrate binding protein [Phycicoccus mangrovi]MBT9256631.1 tripartite tricarboxylate transporter substrate binding protein [Phycicoccus mangrovi]MBT9274805.1 tripartite tricarboxylate transporter substrate binding protein [Phycicoccus mangrovi]